MLLLVFAGLLAAPASANEVTLDLEADFVEDGPLEGGYLEGTFSYELEASDINPNVTNVGVFDMPEFEFKVFDEQSNMVETLTDENSVGHVSLTAPLSTGEASIYQISTIPNDFFATGTLINVTFDYPEGGDPNAAPQALPGDFEDGQFALAIDIDTPQPIANAVITASEDSVATSEPVALLGLFAVATTASVFKLSKK